MHRTCASVSVSTVCPENTTRLSALCGKSEVSTGHKLVDGSRQGIDKGTCERSCFYCHPAERRCLSSSCNKFPGHWTGERGFLSWLLPAGSNTLGVHKADKESTEIEEQRRELPCWSSGGSLYKPSRVMPELCLPQKVSPPQWGAHHSVCLACTANTSGWASQPASQTLESF